MIDLIVVVALAGALSVAGITRLQRRWPNLSRKQRVILSTRLVDFVASTAVIITALLADSWWLLAVLVVMLSATYAARRHASRG